MRFAFLYHGGTVPEAEQEQNCDQLWRWLDQLKAKGAEVAGVAMSNGKTISANSVAAYSDDVFAVSIIDADSMETAIALTKDWPELQHGGRIDILQAQ